MMRGVFLTLSTRPENQSQGGNNFLNSYVNHIYRTKFALTRKSKLIKEISSPVKENKAWQIGINR